MGQPMIYDHSSDPEVLAGEYFLNQDQLFVRAAFKNGECVCHNGE